jgi:hypothetical protein
MMNDTTDTPPDPACPQCDGELEERPSFYHRAFWCDGCTSYVNDP